MPEHSIAGKSETQVASGGNRTLQGRIEAIGIHELLRLSAIKGSTGMLLVFNDETDAQLFYEQGHLVAALSSGPLAGTECLTPVLQMAEGEFEFTDGLVSDPSAHTPGLHEVMMVATKEYFEREIRNRRRARSVTAEEEVKTSGVHKVGGVHKAGEASAPQKEARESADRATVRSDSGFNSPAPGPWVADEMGHARIGARGRVLERFGTFTPQDLVLVTLALKIADGIGRSLAAGGLRRTEIHDREDKILCCGPTQNGTLALKLRAEADLDATWERVPG